MSLPVGQLLSLPDESGSMWHELRVVLHNRENALITQAVRDFTRDESAFAETAAGHWVTLSEAVENMPYE